MFEEVPATKYRPKSTERTRKKPGGGCWKGGAFNLIARSVITDNPFVCVSYMTAGETHDPVEKTRERYTAKMVYEDVDARTVGTGPHKFNTTAGFNTGAAALLAHPLFPVIISWVLYHD
jgi:hypothetical protein